MESDKRLIVEGNSISYELRRSSRAKHLRVTVYRGGRVAVTLPRRASEELATRFVQAKAHWITSKVRFFERFKELPGLKNNREDFLKYELVAKNLIERKIAHFNQWYGFSGGKVLVKNLKSKWGSCSRRGVLTFNYLMVFLPDCLTDYIVVHELCHLKEFNHSKRFWKLVAQVMPGYQTIKKELKQRGFSADF